MLGTRLRDGGRLIPGLAGPVCGTAGAVLRDEGSARLRRGGATRYWPRPGRRGGSRGCARPGFGCLFDQAGPAGVGKASVYGIDAVVCRTPSMTCRPV